MVEDILFLLLWFMLPFFWHYLMKLAGLSLFHLSIPSVLIASMYIFQYIGLPALYFQLDINRSALVNDKWLLFEVFLYTSLTITMLCIGYIIAKQSFGELSFKDNDNRFFKKKFTSFYKIKFDIFKLSRINLGLFFLITISTAVLVIYLSKIGLNNIAFLISIGAFESDLTSSMARSNMGNSFDGKYHWYKLFMNDLLVFSVLIIFSQYLMKKNFLIMLMLAMTFLAVSFVMLMTTEKGPIGLLIISLFFVYIVTRLNGKVSLRKGFYLVFILLLLFLMFGIYIVDNRSLLSAINIVLSRVFTGQIQASYLYLDYFQNHQDLLFGRSFPNPNNILPFEHFDLTKKIMIQYFSGDLKSGVTGSMPTVFWGEMYGNFGFIAVPISSLLVGFGLYGLNSFIFRFKKTPILVGFYVWMMIHFMTLSVTSLSNFIIDIYMFTIILFFFILSFFAGRGKISYSRKRTPNGNKNLKKINL